MTAENTDTIVQLNLANATVAEQIKGLHDAAYSVEARLLGLEEFSPLKRTVESYSNASSTFFGCMRNSHCVGSVEIEADDSAGIEISSLVVDPGCSRQGIATKLMMHVMNIAGPNRIVVSTAGANCPAISLYEGLGFRKTDAWVTADGLHIVELTKSAGNPVEEGNR